MVSAADSVRARLGRRALQLIAVSPAAERSVHDFGLRRIVRACIVASAVLPALALPTTAPLAQTVQRGEQDQREQQRLQDQRRELLPRAPDVLSGAAAAPPDEEQGQETPCFTIDKIELIRAPAAEPDNADSNSVPRAFPASYDWVLPRVEPFRGKCLGEKGINRLVGAVQNALIARGLVTTRAVVGLQNLRSGALTITIVEGRLHAVVPGEGTPASFPWRSALPLRPGDIVDQHALEQALENFKRLPTADTNFRIVPADGTGLSDLAIDWKQEKMWRVSAEVNDGGTKATGKYQGTATGYLENLLGLNDIAYVSINHNLEGTGGRETFGGALHYSFVYDEWLASIDAGRRRYAQTVSGSFQDYNYSGTNTNVAATVSRVIHRDSSSKTSLGVGVWVKSSNNYIDDTELDVQRRRTAGFSIEGRHRQHLGQAVIDAAISYSIAERWFGALPAPEDAFGEGTSLPRLLRADVTGTMPFSLGPLRFSLESNWRGQWTDQPLVVVDRFSIGGRTTVRGFDGEQILLGERGWISRNTLSMPIADSGQELYVGLDHGAVEGPSTQYLTGRRLTGAVAGLRGRIRFTEYDVFVGIPVSKPEGLITPPVTAGFMVRATY